MLNRKFTTFNSRTNYSRDVIGKKEKMNKNYIPKYKYNRVMKDDPKFKSLESVLNSEETIWQNSKYKTIKGYSDDYNSVTTIVTTNEIDYTKEIAYEIESSIKDSSIIHVREKGYHKFVDIKLQAIPANNNQISISTKDEEISELRKSNSQFHQFKNVSFLMSRVKCEEIIANITIDIGKELKIEPFQLCMHKILCHPIDTKAIHIYEAVIKIFSQILGIEPSTIKEKIEEKLSSYEFLFSEINPVKMEFIKSNGKEEYNGMRLVWYNKELSSNSILHKSIDADSPIAKEIKSQLINTKESNIAAPCIPIYRDAIVYRNEENEIIAHFNICFECLKIESHNRTLMPVTTELMSNLNKIINPADNNG